METTIAGENELYKFIITFSTITIIVEEFQVKFTQLNDNRTLIVCLLA